MSYETEGRCPRCNRAMPHRGVKSVTCDGKSYTFPYRLYYCHWHGYWVWRGSHKGHELFDFSKHKRQAIEVKPLPSGVASPTLDDYRIVKMKCPYCEYEWEQYDKTWTTSSGGVYCPECGVEIPKEKAIVKNEGGD